MGPKNSTKESVLLIASIAVIVLLFALLFFPGWIEFFPSLLRRH